MVTRYVLLLAAACGSGDSGPRDGAAPDGHRDGAVTDDGSTDGGACDGGVDCGIDAGIDAAMDGGIGDPIATCLDVDGSRIRFPKRRHPDDALENGLYITDTELGERCEYLLAGDGEVRCMPSGGVVQLVYADAACTSGLLEATFAKYPPGQRVTAALGADDCTNGLSEFVVGEDATPPAFVYFRDASGACSSRFATGDFYHHIAAETPPTSFVKGTVRQLATGRITMRAIDGDDGSRWCVRDIANDESNMAVFDADFDGAACKATYTFDDKTRCVPDPGLAPWEFFADATCTTKKWVMQSGIRCRSPILPERGAMHTYLPSERNACNRLGYKVTGPGPETTAFSRRNGVCSQITFELVEPGSEISLTRFGEISFARTSHGGRLERWFQVIDGVTTPAQSWHDNLLGFECWWSFNRCIPVTPLASPPYLPIYSSAACDATIPDVAWFHRELSSPCFADEVPTAIARFNPAGPLLYSRVGSKLAGPFWYRPNAACEPLPEQFDVYAIGADVTSQLVTATVQ